MPAVLLSILNPLFVPSSSISLSYFILAVPMRESFGKHWCMSSPFPIAILNGTVFFSRVTTWSTWSKSSLSKTNYNNNHSSRISPFFFCFFFSIILSISLCYFYGPPGVAWRDKNGFLPPLPWKCLLWHPAHQSMCWYFTYLHKPISHELSITR